MALLAAILAVLGTAGIGLSGIVWDKGTFGTTYHWNDPDGKYNLFAGFVFMIGWLVVVVIATVRAARARTLGFRVLTILVPLTSLMLAVLIWIVLLAPGAAHYTPL